MKLRLFNKKYKVAFKFSYAEDKRKASVLLSLNGIKFKTTDHRIKCYFEDYKQFTTWLKDALKLGIFIEVI